MVIIFDVVGTLFSLEPLKLELQRQGLPDHVLRQWFARLLMTAMAATLAGRYIPFQEAAEASLRQLAVADEFAQEAVEPVLAALHRLEPWPEAGTTLTSLREQGHRLLGLTNSSAEAAADLIVQAEMEHFFDQVLSADEAKACKPHPAPYRLALERAGVGPQEAWMIAAHGWDIVGAAAVGLQTVWISRLEKRWPFPDQPPGAEAADLAGVPAAVAAQKEPIPS